MVDVFREVRRVLRSDGTVWLNLGDSMAAGKSGRDDNSAADRARMDAHGHGGGVKLQETGNTGKAQQAIMKNIRRALERLQIPAL